MELMTSPYDNTNRANLIGPIAVARSYDQEIDGRLIHVAVDQNGECYVRLNYRPEVQYFVSLLMSPACSLASVVRASNETYEDGENRGKPVHYSHMVNMANAQPASRDELFAEHFLLGALVDDFDHLAIKNVRTIDDERSVRYYTFDFGAALQSLRHFVDGCLIQDSWITLTDLFEELGSATAASLLSDKIHTLRQIYSNDGGYELFVTQLKKAGIDDSLTQMDPCAREFINPQLELYKQFIFRIDALNELLSQEDLEIRLQELIRQY